MISFTQTQIAHLKRTRASSKETGKIKMNYSIPRNLEQWFRIIILKYEFVFDYPCVIRRMIVFDVICYTINLSYRIISLLSFCYSAKKHILREFYFANVCMTVKKDRWWFDKIMMSGISLILFLTKSRSDFIPNFNSKRNGRKNGSSVAFTVIITVAICAQKWFVNTCVVWKKKMQKRISGP